MKKSTTLIFLLVMASYIFAQDVDSNTFKEYKEYRRVFDTEMKRLNDPAEKPLPKYKVLLPEDTPEEFLLLPSSNENHIYSIGISDPGMDREQAHALALLRAKSLLTYFKGINIQHISDMYTDEHSQTKRDDIANKYVDFYRLNAGFALDTNDIKIIKDTTNKYGETILLIEYTPRTNNFNQIIKCNSDCLITEFRSNTNFEINQRVEIYCELIDKKENEENYHFISRRVQKQFDVNSSYNKEEIDPPLYTLRYKNTVDISDSIADTKIKSLLTDGLWNGLIDCLIQNLFVASKLKSSVMKSTTDNYNERHQNLNREVATSKASVRLDNIFIHNNRIFVDITIF